MKQAEILPKRVYLSGADYFQVILERDIQKRKIGNIFLRFAVSVEKTEVKKTRESIYNSPILYWCFNTQLRSNQFFNLPYWEFNDKKNPIEIIESKNSLEKHINETSINVNIRKEAPILIHQLNETEQSTFVISIHHSLIDGRGMGILSKHLSESTQLSNEELLQLFPQKSKTKQGFFRRFGTIWEMRNFVKKTTKGKISKTIPTEKPSKIKIKFIHFSEEETQKIEHQAKLNGATFGTNFFQMACCVKIYQNYLTKDKKAIWFPVPFDGRKRGGVQPIFNNFINFTFFRIEEKQGLTQLVTTLKNQFNQQLNDEIPLKYTVFLNAMLRIPEKLYYLMLKTATGKKFAHFLYSSIGESAHDLKSTFDGKTKNISIIPPLTYPPGISFIFYRFNKKIQISFVYPDTLAQKVNIQKIENQLKNALLHGNTEV